MSRRCKIKHDLCYLTLREETLKLAAVAYDGSIKGTKLPRDQQEIEFFCPHRQQEIRAKIGDVIVELAPGVLEVYPLEMFRLIFKDVDPIHF